MKKSDNYSKTYLEHRVADTGLLNVVIEQLQLKKEMKLLDFGCGTGNYLLALQQKGFSNLFALDKDDSMIEIATRRTGIAVKKGTHLNIPFQNDFFDSIMIIAMIHFIEDIHSLFKNLSYVCKKDGRVVIATQSHKQVDDRFYNKYFPTLAEIDKQRYHEPKHLISVAEEVGFSCVGLIDYSSGTDMFVDDKYFDLIKNKSFFVLRLLPDDEFSNGIGLFKKEMEERKGGFIAPFAGWTIITLQRDGEI